MAGSLSARLTLRTHDGSVSESINIDAGMFDGAGFARVYIPDGFTVEMEADRVPVASGPGPHHAEHISARGHVILRIVPID
jgi:hypothetical protein